MSLLRCVRAGVLFLLVAGVLGVGAPMIVAASKEADAKRATEDLKKAKDAKVKVAALEKLGELGQIQYAYVEKAIPDMMKALEDKDAGVRAAAAKAVGQAGSEDPETVSSLVKLLKGDKEESVKIAAAEGLGLLGREILGKGQQPQPTPEPFPQPTPEPLPEPTPALPEPIEAPFPNRPCHVNVPVPVAGIQAWPTLPEVGPPFDQVICVRLIVDGAPAAYTAFVNIYRYNPDGRVIPGIGHTTGGDGTTGFIFYVGDLPINATVPVEVVATFEGREYRTWTSFIRR